MLNTPKHYLLSSKSKKDLEDLFVVHWPGPYLRLVEDIDIYHNAKR